MPRQVRWHKVIPGVIALAVVFAVALGVLLFARVGALHGDTYTVYVATDAARGIIEGSQVWLAGQKVGLVEKIEFRPITADTARRLLLTLDILEEYQPNIRRDSRAQIRSGGTLIGAQVVAITPGSISAPAIEHGDTISALAQGDTEEFASQLAIVSREFPTIVEHLKQLQALLGTGEGSVGADRAVASLGVLQRSMTGLTRENDGTIGRAIDDRRLLERARRAAASADSILQLLASERTSLGRFRRDSSLSREIHAVRAELSIVRSLLATATGTAGRASKDEVIRQELEALEQAMGALADDIARDPLRYIVF